MEHLPFPSAPEAERAVICAMLVDRGTAPLIAAQLDPLDFADGKNCTMFAALAARVKNGLPLDSASLAADHVMSQEEFAGYVDSVETTLNWEWHVGTLRDRRARRDLMVLAQKTLDDVRRPEIQLGTILRTVRDTVAATAQRAAPRSQTPDTVLRGYMEHIAEWGDMPLASSGIPDLDALLGGGVLPGEILAILGGDGSMKTTLALSYVQKWLDMAQTPVLYLSLDMPPERVAFRRLLPIAERSEKQLIRSIQQGDTASEYARAVLETRDAGRFHIEGAPMNVTAIESAIASVQPGLVVWDYLTATAGYDSELTAQRDCVEALRRWQTRYPGITWVILSQMSEIAKAGQRKGEYAGRASGGNNLSRVADAQIELYLDTPPEPKEYQAVMNERPKPPLIAIITKNRSGPKGGMLSLEYDGPTMTFTGKAEAVTRAKKSKPIFKTKWE